MMRRKIICSLFFLYSSFFAMAQSGLYPSDVLTNFYDDTILNTKTILIKEGVKKIEVYKNAPKGKRKAVLLRSVYVDAHANILSVDFCIQNPGKKKVYWWYKETYQYYDTGEVIMKHTSSDVRNDTPFLTEIKYRVNDTTTKTATTTFFAGTAAEETPRVPETMFDYYFYNRKGQLLKTINILRNNNYAQIYIYNSQGQIDTVFHDNTGKYEVYTRSRRNGNTIIQCTGPYGMASWIYNAENRCIGNMIQTGRLASKYVDYLYNANGTLSEAIIKEAGMETVNLYYSYSF